MNFRILLAAATGFLVSGCMTYEKRVIQAISINEFHNGYAVCVQDEKTFFIDSSGRRKSGKYDEAWDFSHGYAVACRRNDNGDRLFVILDSECKEINYPIAGVYGSANSFGNIWINTSSGFSGGWALLNIETGSILTPIIDHIDCISNKGTAVVSRFVKQTGGIVGYYEYALYDGQGNELAPFGKFSFIGNYHNGLALYSTTGYFHYSQTYDADKERKRSVSPFRGTKNGGEARVGYIDESGTVVSPERFVYAGEFNDDGYACVLLLSGMDFSYRGAHRYSYIRRKDMQVLKGIELVKAKASFLQDGQWIVGKDDDGASVLVNRKGKVHSFGKDVNIAKCGNYYLTRRGREYKFYLAEPEGDFAYLCSITGNADDVVTIEENRNGDCICFYSSYQQRNGYYPRLEYNLDGTCIMESSEFLPPYDKHTGELTGRLRNTAFK